MTVFKAFSINDVKAGAWSTPIFQRSDAAAIRAFADACKDPKNQYGQHPTDYHLYRVGAFDEDVGGLFGEEPVHLIHGVNTLEMESE